MGPTPAATGAATTPVARGARAADPGPAAAPATTRRPWWTCEARATKRNTRMTRNARPRRSVRIRLGNASGATIVTASRRPRTRPARSRTTATTTAAAALRTRGARTVPGTTTVPATTVATTTAGTTSNT